MMLPLEAPTATGGTESRREACVGQVIDRSIQGKAAVRSRCRARLVRAPIPQPEIGTTANGSSGHHGFCKTPFTRKVQCGVAPGEAVEDEAEQHLGMLSATLL